MRAFATVCRQHYTARKTEWKEYMPPIPMKLKIERTHFLLTFAATVLVLFIIRCIHPEIAFDRLATAADTTAARPIRPDSIAMQSKRVDSLLLSALPSC